MFSFISIFNQQQSKIFSPGGKDLNGLITTERTYVFILPQREKNPFIFEFNIHFVAGSLLYILIPEKHKGRDNRDDQ